MILKVPKSINLDDVFQEAHLNEILFTRVKRRTFNFNHKNTKRVRLLKLTFRLIECK